MKENEKNIQTQEMTKSQAKRAERKKETQQKKRKENINKTISLIISILIGLAVVVLIARGIYKKASKVKPSSDYSACLEENGYIQGTGAADIELPDYKNLVIPMSEVEFTDAEIDENIENYLESNKVLSSDESLAVADGDEVNIDYTGSIDGVAFDGGTAEGADLVIGSGSFIDGFEEQLIGATVGSNFDINVTFPEDYSTAELAGQDAVFNITLNGIYTKAEFNDEFVAENLGEYASTVEEYRQYLKDSNLETNVHDYIENYLTENSNVIKYNKKYLKNLKATIKYDDQVNYENMIEMYNTYYGYSPYEKFEDYTGMTEDEYEESVADTALSRYKVGLLYQSILELEGVSATADDYKAILVAEGYDESEYESKVETYGEPYLISLAMKEKAIDLVKGMATIQ